MAWDITKKILIAVVIGIAGTIIYGNYKARYSIDAFIDRSRLRSIGCEHLRTMIAEEGKLISDLVGIVHKEEIFAYRCTDVNREARAVGIFKYSLNYSPYMDIEDVLNKIITYDILPAEAEINMDNIRKLVGEKKLIFMLEAPINDPLGLYSKEKQKYLHHIEKILMENGYKIFQESTDKS